MAGRKSSADPGPGRRGGEAVRRLIGPAAAVAVTVRIAFSPAIVGYGGELVIEAACWVPFLLWLLAWATSGRLSFPGGVVVWPVLLFAAAVAFSPLFASYRFGAARSSLIWLSHLSIFFAVIGAGRGAWRPILAAAVAAAAVQAAAGIFFVHEGANYIPEDPQFRQLSQEQQMEAIRRLTTPLGNLGSPNVLASFLLLFGPVGAAYLITRSGAGAHRWWVLPATALIAYCFVLCRSFGAYLGAGMAAAVFVFVGLGERGRRRMSRAAAAVAFLSFLVLPAAMATDLSARVRTIDVRLAYWRTSLSILREHPLAGVGLDNFGDAFLRHREPSPEEVTDPHNSVLMVFTELGIIGGVPFLLTWHFLVRPHLRRRIAGDECDEPDETALLSGLVCLAAAFYPLLAHTFRSDDQLLRAGAVAGCVTVWLATYHGVRRIPAPLAHRALLASLCGALLHSLFDQQFAGEGMNASLWLAAAMLLNMTAASERRAVGSLRRGPIPYALAAVVSLGIAGLCWGGVKITRTENPWEAVPADAEAAVEGAKDAGLSFDERKGLYERAIRLRPACSVYRHDYALFLLASRRPEFVQEARRELLESVSLDPNGITPRGNLARFYDEIGLPDRALAEYKAVLSIDARLRPLYPEYALTEQDRAALQEKVKGR